MNKTAVSMKTLLIATCLLAMSTTAIANSTDRQRQSAVSNNLTIVATYIETLALSLNVSEIDFGEVYTGVTTGQVEVTAQVVGDKAEGFEFEINSDNNAVLLSDDPNTAHYQSITGTANLVDGKSDLTFFVDLLTSGITESFPDANIEFKVTYNSIAGTTTTPAS